MLLNKATTLERVNQWSEMLSAPWNEEQRSQLADQLIMLANVIEPHLVADIPLATSQIQAYVLARMVAHLEDWLVRAASYQRRALGMYTGSQLVPANDSRLGLISATEEEVEALPGIGAELTDNIRRYLAKHPIRELEDLQIIHGIGAERIEQLRETSYLDKPIAACVSPSMWAFVMTPDIQHALALLESSDIMFVFGDPRALKQRLNTAMTSVFSRFSAFIAFVTDRARLAVSDAAGSLGSDALQWLNRHQLRLNFLQETEATSGTLLINDAYVDEAVQTIEAATSSVSLMIFLGTIKDSDDGRAPFSLVTALEHAANRRGVDVRVIVDQDDGGEPYKSALINRPIVEFLQTHNVKVKFDTKQKLLHSKVLIVDEKFSIVGSHNWTRTAFTRTYELSVLLDQKPVAAAFQRRFDDLWNSLPELSESDSVAI